MAANFVVDDDISLTLRPGSELARLSGLSRHQLLTRIALAIGAAIENESPFADWCDRFLDRREVDAAFDTDDGFVSYRSFCADLGVAVEHRLSHAEFARQLTAAGIHGKRFDGGRVMRPGYGLRQEPISLRPSFIGVDLDRFLQQHCSAYGDHVTDRAGSKHLFELYRSWAEQTGAQQLNIRTFKQAMERRGLTQRQSNGMKWQGVKLLPEYREANDSPRAPCAGEPDNSISGEGFGFLGGRRG